MKLVAINALNSNSGGGKSIRDSFLRLLNDENLTEKYIVIGAKESGLDFITNPNIEVIEMPRYWSRAFMAPLIYRFALGHVLKRLNADVVLNLGDLIVHSGVKQIYVFDWPYALDVHPTVWKDMNLLDWINRRLKLWLLKRDFDRPDIVVAQTKFIKGRLKELYSLRDIRVINNAVTISTSQEDKPISFALPSGLKFLYPTVYYPHKNLEILIELAGLIKINKLNYRIVTTVNPDTEAARQFLDSIESCGLRDIITNVGQVRLNQMHVLYRQCDALLMPTLLESFSIVYLEAMHHRVPVFTSDMWFAKAVCGDAATYFDPLDAEHILRSLEKIMQDPKAKSTQINKGLHQLSSFPTWQQNFVTYRRFISEMLASQHKI